MSIFRCALEASAGSALFVNVFHVEAITGSAAAIGASFLANVAGFYANVLHTSVTLDQIVVTEIVAQTQATQLIGVGGTQGGDMLPPQAAAVISWRTAYIGRANRGRSFIFGQAEASQTAGIINAPQLALLDTLATKLRSTWPASFSGKLVLYHRETFGATDIISHICRDVVYTQRRRTLGVGA